MDGIIKIIATLVKLTLGILEGVLRAVLATFLSMILAGSVVASGMVISMAVIKYGMNVNDCDNHRAMCGLVLVTGWALAIYLVMKTIRGFF